MKSGKRILVTVLDWGLGHAARCIPIIRILLQRNHEVLIASNGNALELLKIEFPGLHFFELPPYNPVYPTSGKNMVTKMAFQLPKFLGAVKKEHKHTEEIVKQHQIDFVISDNRYGCFSERIKSVLITHQVNIMMPETHKSIEKTVNTYNHGLIQKFSECWIPSPPQFPNPGAH